MVGKALVAVAAEGWARYGSIRLRRIVDASAASWKPSKKLSNLAGLVHTDGWEGYAGLENKGYRHEVSGKRQSASKLLPKSIVSPLC